LIIDKKATNCNIQDRKCVEIGKKKGKAMITVLSPEQELSRRRDKFMELKAGTICGFGVTKSGRHNRIALVLRILGEVEGIEGIELTDEARQLIIAGRPCPFVTVPFAEMRGLNILSE